MTNTPTTLGSSQSRTVLTSIGTATNSLKQKNPKLSLRGLKKEKSSCFDDRPLVSFEEFKKYRIQIARVMGTFGGEGFIRPLANFLVTSNLDPVNLRRVYDCFQYEINKYGPRSLLWDSKFTDEN